MKMGDAFNGVQNHVSGGVNEGSSEKRGWSDEFFVLGLLWPKYTWLVGRSGHWFRTHLRTWRTIYVNDNGDDTSWAPAGASPCDEVTAAPVYGDEGLEVTGGRGLGYDEHLGGSPAVEGLSEAANGGEVDDANRSVGKESIGAIEMVFSAEATGGKRLGNTSSKTSLKNMRKKVASSFFGG
ncbi:hypothetical protein ACSQ67_011763 [Phaseolus vulgaris]